MAQLFPKEHVLGFIGSIILTIAALSVVQFDVSLTAGLVILWVTALAQASLQLVLFMHIGETDDKGSIYVITLYSVVIGLVTVFGSLFAMIWGY
ncbi:MAG: cytochrome aa3 quinol oxidase subunit IV [Kurthia gibsonii]|uniref:Quinol oxidase subunit 4 n=1 Tax=Kurthia gibsonii TaxID=33946 RepID=A0ABU9LIV4_9BACL|nr:MULTISPECIES: cytochrome aa3 quinol oxidase subunit IV [Kurthia]AMA63221.1 cytochrome aa3 quinol oxidase, subunit IV [Kurthia sp. 11kri321]MEB6112509.1 cytochrome aa3 quinol oxidase subunit IV [Kurthia gibsonii]MEB7772571.1 cytochrome aa3 quinol oxidase subunit IV [Kurthia gibsonii]RXH51486.1 cytochrome aa3 quinol oxidase subunit IV [Kurthia gibsonii]WIL37863.1 cytochrome aa3 quinol oxidase subunit IV [Kurthia sp. YJT4]